MAEGKGASPLRARSSDTLSPRPIATLRCVRSLPDHPRKVLSPTPRHQHFLSRELVIGCPLAGTWYLKPQSFPRNSHAEPSGLRLPTIMITNCWGTPSFIRDLTVGKSVPRRYPQRSATRVHNNVPLWAYVLRVLAFTIVS